MICDMCGEESATLIPTMVEGTELNLCSKCSRFGQRIRKPIIREKAVSKKTQESNEGPEEVEMIRSDFARIIRSRRAEMKLKQEELARLLAEKEAIISKMESGSFEPSLSLAAKMERMMQISLIETHKIAPGQTEKKSIDGKLTLGDFVKIKKRKN